MNLWFNFSTMASTDLIYIVDLDEFIVPRRDLSPNTTAMLLEIAAAAPRALASEGKQPDALLFRNTFFCSEFNKNVDFDEDFDIFNIFNRQVQIIFGNVFSLLLFKIDGY